MRSEYKYQRCVNLIPFRTSHNVCKFSNEVRDHSIMATDIGEESSVVWLASGRCQNVWKRRLKSRAKIIHRAVLAA